MIPTRLRKILESLENFKDEKINFHPEPNVRNHLGQCATLALQRGYHADLTMAAMLHDIGKNTHDKLEWVQHAHRGARIVAPDTNELVVWLVRNHMKMYDLEKMSEGKRLELTNHPWFPNLVGLHEIDKLARQAHGKHMAWDDIFDTYDLKMDGRPNMVMLMIGIQASGKTSTSKELIRISGGRGQKNAIMRTSRDDLRELFGVGPGQWRHQEEVIIKVQQDQIRLGLGRGQQVIVDNCHNTVKRRKDVITWLRSEFPGVKIKAMVVYAPLDVCLKRNKDEHGQPHRHKVLIPDEVIKQFHSDMMSGFGIKSISGNENIVENKLISEGFNYVQFVRTASPSIKDAKAEEMVK